VHSSSATMFLVFSYVTESACVVRFTGLGGLRERGGTCLLGEVAEVMEEEVEDGEGPGGGFDEPAVKQLEQGVLMRIPAEVS
jgi:hypothetical protein